MRNCLDHAKTHTETRKARTPKTRATRSDTVHNLAKAAGRTGLAGFGKTIKAARTLRRWTQQELAERTGLTQPWICQIESDKRHPDLGTFYNLCTALGLSADLALGLSPSIRRI